MNKKIIAILLVFTLVITCFVACKKHDYETTKVGSLDLLLYTDKDGNTVINEDNQIIAVVTDSDGEIVTHENGEEQTHYVQISGSYVGEGYIQDKNCKLAIPEGWEGTEHHKVVKKDTNENCYIKFAEMGVFDNGETFDEYFEELDNNNKEYIEAFEKEGYTLTIDSKKTSVGTTGYTGMWYAYKIVDGDGKVIHYAENFYFTVAKTLYVVNYACVDGEGYDESFNFADYVREGFTFNG